MTTVRAAIVQASRAGPVTRMRALARETGMVRGGTVLTAADEVVADVLIDDETVVAVATPGSVPFATTARSASPGRRTSGSAASRRSRRG